MDAFERVVAQILNHQGYWTRTEFKVELTREEKKAIGRPSSPRWELDVVAYSPKQNLILAVECKSFLDSGGVALGDFDASKPRSKRFKLFVEPETRQVIFRRLVLQLEGLGLCRSNANVKLALAAGKIVRGAEDSLRALSLAQGFDLYDPQWLKTRLTELSRTGYDNEIASVVSKLILRGELS